ncbi:unnamed protein product [Larinioides sclopetarius]|uniref:No apical meristem-associated C-terminal domain-containing protein n=1 Tax=Larinioides sclopetarius TaxID=280406 RepID=A0AAV2BJU8_9ARAC
MFNGFPGVRKRNVKQLITIDYKNLKSKGNRSQASRRFEIFKTGGGPNPNASANPVEERLLAMGALKMPLINIYDSDAAYHKMTTSDTTHCENSINEEELQKITEVQYPSADISEKQFDMELSDAEGLPSSIQENYSQEIPAPSFQSIDSQSYQSKAQTALSPDVNKDKTQVSALWGASTPSIKTYKLKREKKQVSGSAKAADSLIQQTELKKQILKEQHEWEREKFMLEKEKHLLEIRLLNEQIKMYERINEKIEKGEGVQICVNINK